MNTYKHKPFLEDGTPAFRVGEQVANTDVNLAYFQVPPLSPSENIATIQTFMHGDVGFVESGDIHERERNMSFSEEDDPISEVYPMWNDQNGYLAFASAEAAQYPGSDTVYRLLSPNLLPGSFLLTNRFSDSSREKGLFYLYVLKEFVYEKGLSQFSKNYEIHNVTPQNISIFDQKKNNVTSECTIRYERVAQDVYRAYIYTDISDKLSVSYKAAEKTDSGYIPGMPVQSESYIHYPVMNSSKPIQPTSSEDFFVEGDHAVRKLKVVDKALQVPDTSLHIKWRLIGTANGKTLRTPWHYNTVGNTYKDVSYQDVAPFMATYFPQATYGNISGITAEVQTLNGGSASHRISGQRLEVRSNGSHRDIFPLIRGPFGSGTLSRSVTCTATARQGVISGANKNRWSVQRNGNEVSKALDTGTTAYYNSGNDTAGEWHTHLYIARPCSLTLQIHSVDQSQEKAIQVLRRYRSSVTSSYSGIELISNSKKNSLTAQIPLSIGWHNIIIKTNGLHLEISSIVSHLKKALEDHEWSMASSVSTGSNWSQSRTVSISVPFGQERQYVPTSFHDQIISSNLVEFSWKDVTPSNESTFRITKIENFKQTGAFSVLALGNSRYAPTEDLLAIPRKATVRAYSMFYRCFTDVTVEFVARGKIRGWHPAPGNSSLNGNWKWNHIRKWRYTFGSDKYTDVSTRSYPYVDSLGASGQSGDFRCFMQSSLANMNGKTLNHEIDISIYVDHDRTVTHPIFIPQVESRIFSAYDVYFEHFHNNIRQKVVTISQSNVSYDLVINMKQGWNKLRFCIDNKAWMFHRRFDLFIRNKRPLWQSLLNAGYSASDVIGANKPLEIPMIENTYFASKSGRTYFDPKQDFTFSISPSDFDFKGEAVTDFSIHEIKLKSQDNNAYTALTVTSNSDGLATGKVEMTNAFIEPLTNQSFPIDVDVLAHPSERVWITATEPSSRRDITASYIANNLGLLSNNSSDPDVRKNVFMELREDPASMTQFRLRYGNQNYTWDKRIDRPYNAIFINDLLNYGNQIQLQHSSHYHNLLYSKRKLIKYNDSLGGEIDNKFGSVKVQDIKNADTAQLKKNWYVSIDAIGSEKREFKVDWAPSHPVYTIYSNLLEYKGQSIQATYSIPEYLHQNFDISDTNEIKRKYVFQESPRILSDNLIQVSHTPVWSPLGSQDSPGSYVQVENYEVESIDASTGIIRLNANISSQERLLVNYYYLENKLEYRGFPHPKGFMHLDLNPSKYHTFSTQNGNIPGHIIHDTPIVDIDSTHLIGRMILLYLRPTELRLRDQTIWPLDSQIVQGVHHTDMSAADLLNYDPFIIPLGQIYIVPNTSLRDLILIDTRSRGGGLKEAISEEIIRTVDEESKSFWDIGYWDGMPYQANGVMYLRLPQSLLKENGGAFSKHEIEEIVTKHAALGVVPIITYVDASIDDEEWR